MLPAKNANVVLSEGGFPPISFMGSSIECTKVTGKLVSFPISKSAAAFALQSALMEFFTKRLVSLGA